MTATIKVPASQDAMVKGLTGLDGIVRAKEWERAAIVYAFTEPQQGQRSDLDGKSSKSDLGEKSPKLSIEAFAALGIVGLTTRNTVRAYREAWAGHKTTDKRVKPGDVVAIPNDDWPPIDHGRGSHATTVEIRAAIVKNPDLVREAIESIPAVADVATTAVAESVDLQMDVYEKTRIKRPEPPAGTPTRKDIKDMEEAALASSAGYTLSNWIVKTHPFLGMDAEAMARSCTGEADVAYTLSRLGEIDAQLHRVMTALESSRKLAVVR